MDNQVIRVLHALCEQIGTPRALSVKMLSANGEWAGLQELRVVPANYDCPEAMWKDALVTELLRKCDLETTVDKRAAAVRTFWECEARNKRTNDRLSRFLPNPGYLDNWDAKDESVAEFIAQWRKDVKLIVGQLPTDLTPRFSGGATYADTGDLKTIPDKMSSTPTLYQGTRCLLPFWHETAWAHALLCDRPWQSDPRTVRGNIFFTVPKDGTKFRGCCKEASISVAYQLDAGRILRRRLRRIGIDLKEGQDRHKALACQASIDGSLATIDMSNASDTVCRVLVQLLLPEQWHELLTSLRASHTRLDGRFVRLEKFSSMGNGFTFELETLVFATLARRIVAAEGGDPDCVTCYGDDLIVPTEHCDSVLAALAFFGFEPNKKKTFVEGRFRESCGGDFFDGVPVRAVNLEEIPDEPQKWIALANGLRRVAGGDDLCPTRWDIVRTAWQRCVGNIPSVIRRCRGPSYLGDIVLHDTPDRWSWVTGPVRGYDNTWDTRPLLAYLPIPSVLPWHHWLPSVQLASCTLGMPSRGVTPRGGVSGYRIGCVPCGARSTWTPRPRV